MKRTRLACAMLAASLWSSGLLFAHCEIPCGIYGDRMRLEMIAEHITTVEKSMKQIQTLSKAGDRNYNQIVRWVQNKEKHADEIQKIVTQYFMTQRVKPADQKDDRACEQYVTRLTLLHKMLVSAMKTKQTTDLEHVVTLRKLLKDFGAEYLHERK